MVPPVYAEIPSIPDIPKDLPDSVRAPLVAKRQVLEGKQHALIAEGNANTRQCTGIKKGSSEHEACLILLSQFNAKVDSLWREKHGLDADIGAAVAAEARRRISQIGATQTPNNDPMVVDARVPPMGANLLAQVPELERSPAADRIRKGFQAVMTVPRDWPVALAWWQEALQRDPNNAALIRSVDLAQWMVDSKKRAANRQTASSYPAIDAFLKYDATEVIQFVEQANKKNAIQDAEAERIKNRINQEVKQRVAAKEAPKPSPSSASMPQMAAEGDRVLSERMFEDGLQFLLMGEYKHADEMFQRADFQRNFDAGKP